ncbi:DUF6602 domain-containing protein [Plantibacter sp. YIM 135249]|uniref:DUF6602 domain-containing protein n=1 Tax=Plantibacter sp. YIM 135249 TaxID=3423918 RepID=UPI003D331B57
MASQTIEAEMARPKTVDLEQAFLQRQKLLSAELEIPLEFTNHPTTIGDASEANWGRMLKSFLPGRYAIGPVFALDATGAQSEQVDLAIYDRQYSPLWFKAGTSLIVPVESIYCVIEVKQELNATTMAYAAAKVASVRALRRTSAKIVDIYGTQPGPTPDKRPILGGIVGLRTGWRDGIRSSVGTSNITKHDGQSHLDLGIALTDAAFDHTSDAANLDMLTPGLVVSNEGTQLIFFVMRLFRRLQTIGSAMAVDLDVYERALDGIDTSQYSDADL